MPDVRICEMAPRDGLQSLNRDRPVPVGTRVALIESIADAGFDFIEAGSFVSPRAVPQMADTDQVCHNFRRVDGVEYAALVPNLKYYERFRSANLTTVAIFVSASEKYSQFNLRQTIAESMEGAQRVAEAARRDGFKLRAHLSAVFHDIDGADSDLQCVVDLTRRLIEMGCDHIALADTKGTTHPKRIRRVLETITGSVNLDRIAIHLHDAYGLGIANALIAFECGARIFDASVAGLGGTPFKATAKGPSGGNLATEELVMLFESMGVSTGIKLDALLNIGHSIKRILRQTGDPPTLSKMLN